MRRALLIFVALVSVPSAAWPQGGNPLGPEFRVNTYTTGSQLLSRVTVDSSGNFVVIWNDDSQDGSNRGVFGQRYASSGAPLGPEFRVNTYTTGHQAYPVVAADASGNFFVAWRSDTQDGSGSGIFGQRYASSGAPLGPEFRVNTYTAAYQLYPSVAVGGGNFVVVWQGVQGGSGWEIFGQRYASSGAPLGPEFRVNTYTTFNQSYAAVAADSSGNFVVAWESYVEDGSGRGVFGQRYASSGTPLGAAFRVNTYTTQYQRRPSVASNASGSFVVAWQSYNQDGSQWGVFGQRYAAGGSPLGPEFPVNTVTTGYQTFPSIVSDFSGNFVVIWQSDAQDGSSFGIFGQRYASSGTPLGPEFRVNTYTTQYQRRPSVAADASGNFVVTWDSQQDGSGLGVFAQRYAQIVPVELMHFRVE